MPVLLLDDEDAEGVGAVLFVLFAGDGLLVLLAGAGLLVLFAATVVLVLLKGAVLLALPASCAIPAMKTMSDVMSVPVARRIESAMACRSLRARPDRDRSAGMPWMVKAISMKAGGGGKVIFDEGSPFSGAGGR